MASKPKHISAASSFRFFKLWALILRHPLKTIAGAVVIFGGIPTAAAGYGMVLAFIDPAIPALHYWVEWKLAPVILVQNTQAVAIDRFLLYQQQEALAKAQADPAAATSPIVRERIRDLQNQVRDTEARLQRAPAR